ncbi:MAG: hypothetical protein PHU25_04835 [Deltaproteobacteria bacterium]|nr:hypothetical protein [Deltaproteobacteria bacterium]
MADKPKRASEYKSEQVELVRATCLYVATKLGDLMNDVVVVGGLVPSLLIDQGTLPEGASAHVGTMDLDVGLKLALLDEGRYRISPSLATDQGGKLRDIEKDFAAIIAPGLALAFQDRRRVRIEGRTIFGEKATREVWVCGPGAFVVLKALAFLGRGEDKDAYDLYYLVRNFGAGVEDVAVCLRPLLVDGEAQRALEVLRNDFLNHEGIGPRRVAEFLQAAPTTRSRPTWSGS